MIVVADSSPLIYLAWINQLELLASLYGQIVVPEIVYHEVVTRGKGKQGYEQLKAATWMTIKQHTDKNRFLSLSLDLDIGESEAIAISLELNAALLIIDEARGRAKAKELGIPVIGTLGILLEAKAKGLIFSVKEQVEILLEQTTFRVSQPVIDTVLLLANEENNT
ncbi:MAG: DUF3368 domain-containing protein [Saprospiraceae bacterium]|nr:DUF3368 domain-containing protein [Saprospiraceae bacterium]